MQVEVISGRDTSQDHNRIIAPYLRWMLASTPRLQISNCNYCRPCCVAGAACLSLCFLDCLESLDPRKLRDKVQQLPNRSGHSKAEAPESLGLRSYKRPAHLATLGPWDSTIPISHYCIVVPSGDSLGLASHRSAAASYHAGS